MSTLNELQEAGLEPLHFILAYAGLALSLTMKMGEEYPTTDFSFKGFFKKYIISIIFSLIAIPVILVMATDTSMHEFLPINYVTAVLAGWQTQAIFKSTFTMVANRRGLSGGGNGNGGVGGNPQ